jgi:hypothetical protein
VYAEKIKKEKQKNRDPQTTTFFQFQIKY